MAVTVHWVDVNWVIKSSFLGFVRFNTPHTGDDSCDVFLEIIREWGLQRMVHSMATVKPADMINSVELLRIEPDASTCWHQYKATRNLLVRCMAQVLDLAVNECIKLRHRKLTKMRKLLTSRRSSNKGQDQFDDMKIKMGLTCRLSGLEVETRW